MNEVKNNQLQSKKSPWGGFRGPLIICGICLAIAYFIFSLSFFTGKRDEVVCTQLEMVFSGKNDINLIDSAEIVRLLKSQQLYPVGKPLKNVSTESIENALNKSEMIKSSECYTTPAGAAYIYIKQRSPKFRVIGSDSYYIDTEGKRIKASHEYTAYVPVVSGSVDMEMLTGELFDFITFLEKNTFWNAQIEQIYVRPDKKIELVPRVGDSIILLGTLDNYESKLVKLKKLYVNAFNTIGWNRYKTIDLQYKGQIVCTRID